MLRPARTLPALLLAGALAGACSAPPRPVVGAVPAGVQAAVDRLFHPCRGCAAAPALASLRGRGFAALPAAHALATYLPDRDRAGKAFDAEPWETEALQLQGHLFGGATSWPGRGSYRESDADGRIGEERVILEHTRVVVSFVAEADFSPAALAAVADFLRRFKDRTGQDSVAVAIDGTMYLYY